MKFWDSSAIVPLLVREKNTGVTKGIVTDDEDIVVWWATRVECRSALARRKREGIIDSKDESKAVSILNALKAVWSEILPSERIRKRAERVLSLHPLRAGDAFQLAAVLLWAQEDPQYHHIVCLDSRLRVAASQEGFFVLPEDS